LLLVGGRHVQQRLPDEMAYFGPTLPPSAIVDASGEPKAFGSLERLEWACLCIGAFATLASPFLLVTLLFRRRSRRGAELFLYTGGLALCENGQERGVLWDEVAEVLHCPILGREAIV